MTTIFNIVFSFLCRYKKIILDTFVEVIIFNLLISTEINETTIIRIVICSIINFIYKNIERKIELPLDNLYYNTK